MGLLDGTTQQEYYQGNDYGNYQFISLEDIINQFMLVYVGEDKIIPKAKRLDVAFHAQRAMQELSFDTFKSVKAQEITVPANLQMTLPQDYVNYTKISWVDSTGIKHLLYPTTSKTSNPPRHQTDSDGDFLFDLDGNLILSGNLLGETTFQGGLNNWNLNVGATTGTSQSGVTWGPSQTIPLAITASTGWHWDNNKLTLYNGSNFRTIRQSGVPIYSGEKYTLTYTLSGYSAGNYNFIFTDENGYRLDGTTQTANGTYTEEIDMSTAALPANAFDPQCVSFRNDNTGAGVDGVTIDNISLVRVGDEETSSTWSNYKSGTPSENQNNYQDDTYWPMDGSRYGLDPQHAQANGSFYIDDISGKIHFSSNISGKTVVLDYISDSLGTDGEMQVHKFAEEAMYKWISHAILAGKANIPEYQVNRFKKERFAAIRTAKLRLSNIKLEEITQILRGKSKQIKH